MEKLKVRYLWYQSSPKTGWRTDYGTKLVDGSCYLNNKFTFGYWLMLSEPDEIWSHVNCFGSKRQRIATFNIKKWK
jgi:hypothetical protein